MYVRDSIDRILIPFRLVSNSSPCNLNINFFIVAFNSNCRTIVSEMRRIARNQIERTEKWLTQTSATTHILQPPETSNAIVCMQWICEIKSNKMKIKSHRLNWNGKSSLVSPFQFIHNWLRRLIWEYRKESRRGEWESIYPMTTTTTTTMIMITIW